MAITMRRGPYTKFHPEKLMPGEWAVVLAEDPIAKDGKACYICFAPGDTKRIATYEDMKEYIESINGEILAVVNASGDRAITAAEQAELIAGEVARKAASGEFNGKDGEQGPPGESGIVVPISGMFTMSVDADGNLYAHWADGSTAPQFRYDAETGSLYYITPETEAV